MTIDYIEMGDIVELKKDLIEIFIYIKRDSKYLAIDNNHYRSMVQYLTLYSIEENKTIDIKYKAINFNKI